MAIVFQRPKALLDVPTHYCPGCTHGIIHRLVAEAIDERLDQRGFSRAVLADDGSRAFVQLHVQVL